MVKAAWKTNSADVVLTEDGTSAHRRTSTNWVSIYGDIAFTTGVHKFSLQAEPSSYLRLGVEDATIGRVVKPEDNAAYCICRTPHVACFENNIHGKLHSVRGPSVDFQVDLERKRLSVRNAGDTEWIEISDNLPSAVRPWAYLGTANKSVKLSARKRVHDDRKQQLHADLAADFAALLSAGSLSDVTIIIGDAQLSAHSAILAARSPVFAAMLQAPMKESQTREITLHDIEASTMRHVLHFIYTGELLKESMESDSSALLLLRAANRFGLARLEEVCAEHLEDTLDASNVSDVLQEADAMASTALRQACLAFVAENVSD
eukprot:CAMPEP_0197674740 /NCGR_PEP_ID=MMETSP1338-20131121/83557_1 /TAXON_ID=43686 ORGANISM="Pelagodinium beii, Strain RCC1491" /NCGR_SAMPLE_ID=MMETSP1338 /ASSEMBLY_ACC=CAM_ASM_000754 /LENGTH=318 /DNA_ID=CAMNT_0043255195 /DNA_START=28 /DNA_END=981 /DNA_ORIENTATION=+